MKAIILGGTGAIGVATAERLALAGWQVSVTGRNRKLIPQSFEDLGISFQNLDRANAVGITELVGSGADLLVDVLAYNAQSVREILPAMERCASTVLISSRAVYTDAQHHHINGEHPPKFDGPVNEQQTTLDPAKAGLDPFTREGYAPCKRAAEVEALASGLPVSILRPSKIHGAWARQSRTFDLVKAMLENPLQLEIAGNLSSVNQLCAATNTAALIECVGNNPGTRILNSADPDVRTAQELIERIAEILGWDGSISANEQSEAALVNPFESKYPFLLEMKAAERLGYDAVDTSINLLAEEVMWARHSILNGGAYVH